MSWGEFQRLVGLDPSETKTAANADITLEVASSMGIPVSPKGSSIAGWYFTRNKAFAVRHANP